MNCVAIRNFFYAYIQKHFYFALIKILRALRIAAMHLSNSKSEVVQVVITMIIMSMSTTLLGRCECDVQPGQVVLSRHAPGKWRVSGRGQRGGAYRLAATHVRANVVVLMRGVSWNTTHDGLMVSLH